MPDLSSPIRDKHGRLKNKPPIKEETLRRREQHRIWYQENKERLDKKSKEWKEKNRDRRLWHEAKRRYGVSFEEYKELMAREECDLCGTKIKTKNNNKNAKAKHKQNAIDHCHKTEHEQGIIKIRGVLCHQCNKGLGNFNDDIELLEKAIQYLRRNI
tara:strand:- start:164 stop:634 length:471 start_codon:yes stop_codon:yes gene_type:complete